MKIGQQTNLEFTRNLEPIENKQEQFLEDIPDYNQKLQAFLYTNELSQQERVALFNVIVKETGGHWPTESKAAERVAEAEKKAKFPIAWYEKSKFPDRNGNWPCIVYYKKIDGENGLREYYKDILDSEGHLLPSREVYGQKVA